MQTIFYLLYFLSGMEKNEFSKSLAAYYVSKTLVIDSKTDTTSTRTTMN